jgi:5-methylcytosine-specific restriction enzyme subunit McrC
VVGIVAARDCTLEILPKIDGLEHNEGQTRTNLVHMLATALELDISPGALTDVGWQKENLLEILIRLFTDKLFGEVHRGLPRRYVAHEADLPALRGRLDVQRQFRALAASPQRLACRFDDLSPDIALNQVMKAAVSRLSRVARLPENQRRLRELSFAFADVTDVPVSQLRWQDIVLDRTNNRWQALLSLAKLLLGDRFQTTSRGQQQGFSLLFEMNTLFEEYIGRMLQRALVGTGYSVHLQGGRLHCLLEKDLDSGALGTRRFMTKPDIIVRAGQMNAFIVDTKWKRLAARIDDPKQGVSQADVYQMMAYGRLYSCPRLILLYPHHRGLPTPAGVTGCHQIIGCDDELITATIGLDDLRSVPAVLRGMVLDQLSSQTSYAA